MDIRPSHFRKDFVLIKMMSSDFPISLFQIENVLFPASSWLWSGSTGFFYRVLPSFPFKVRVEYERRSFFVCLGAFWFLPLEKKNGGFFFSRKKKKSDISSFSIPSIIIGCFVSLPLKNERVGVGGASFLFWFFFWWDDFFSTHSRNDSTLSSSWFIFGSFYAVDCLFFCVEIGFHWGFMGFHGGDYSFTGFYWVFIEVHTSLITI